MRNIALTIMPFFFSQQKVKLSTLSGYHFTVNTKRRVRQYMIDKIDKSIILNSYGNTLKILGTNLNSLGSRLKRPKIVNLE